jgi:hypothetical protein
LNFFCEIERIGLSTRGFSLVVGCLPFIANQCAMKQIDYRIFFTKNRIDLLRILISKGIFA